MKVYANITVELEVDDKFNQVSDEIPYEEACALAKELFILVEDKCGIPHTSTITEYCNLSTYLTEVCDNDGNSLAIATFDDDTGELFIQ